MTDITHSNLPTLSELMDPLPETHAEWLEHGRKLGLCQNILPWAWGDWWVHGDDRAWGGGRDVAEHAGINYNTLRTYGAVARAFPLSRRLDNLTFAHHQEATSVPPEQRGDWLERAAKAGWSAKSMRTKIKQAKAAARSAEGGGGDEGGDQRGEGRCEGRGVGVDQLLAVANQALDLARAFDRGDPCVSAEELEAVRQVAFAWTRLSEILAVSTAEECVAENHAAEPAPDKQLRLGWAGQSA
jgi:hypothetical protein